MQNGSSSAAGSSGPVIDGWKNATIPEGTELRFIDESVGRGVFATKKFLSGETVMVDTPIVTCQFAWNQTYKYKACEFCMSSLETAQENIERLAARSPIELPFPQCCEVKKELVVECSECPALYCSEKCRDVALKEYHSVLCYQTKTPPETHPIKFLEQYWRQMHYPPETLNIMLLVKLLVKLHCDKDGSLNNKLASFCHSSMSDNEELVHKSLGEDYQEQIRNLRLLVAAAFNAENISQWLTPEGFLKLFVTIGRNGQGVGTSPFAVWVANVEKLDIGELEKETVLEVVDGLYDEMDKVVGHFLDNEGSALYPVQSLVNHSCIANTEVKFPDKNHKVGLVAARDIEPGEEITISYLDLGDLSRSRYSRNKYLQNHYLFTCNCAKCESQLDEDDLTSSEDDDSMPEEEEEEDMEGIAE